MKEADLALLRRFAQDHDAEAFSEIVGRYQNLVYGTCVRILGDATDAEDVAQECFMGLMRKAGTVRSSLAGWLHRCAADMSVNELRRCAARKKREESSCKMNSSVNNGPSWHEVAPYVDGALNELPDDLRIVIVEHFLQRRTQAEIAKELGVSAMTVSRRVEAGLDELRKKLKKAGLIVSAALLASLIAEHAVSAAPAALTVALGKMALAGTVKGGAATGAPVRGPGRWPPRRKSRSSPLWPRPCSRLAALPLTRSPAGRGQPTRQPRGTLGEPRRNKRERCLSPSRQEKLARLPRRRRLRRLWPVLLICCREI